MCAFDVPAVGRDDDQPAVLAVVVESLDQLTAGLGLAVRHRRIGRREHDGAVEDVVRSEAPPAGEAEAHDVGGVLVAMLADRVQGVLRRRAADAELLAERRADRSEQPDVDRAVLAAGDQILLRRQRLADHCASGRHHPTSSNAGNGGRREHHSFLVAMTPEFARRGRPGAGLSTKLHLLQCCVDCTFVPEQHERRERKKLATASRPGHGGPPADRWSGASTP